MPKGVYTRTPEMKTGKYKRIKPPWNIGVLHSETTKEKIRQKALGRKHTESFKKEMGKRVLGKNNPMYGIRQCGMSNPNWRGGIVSFRRQIYNLFEYKHWRHSIFVRDNFTCVECHKVGRRLEAHHIKPFIQIMKENNIKILKGAIQCKELWDIDNGITLCKECHSLTSSYRRRFK